ncbi:MAG TPA: hypothetical protein PKO06_19060 [Candidatus Ozemobacteraceae bacterium]|nr:hypothetical protein [Candidatus Ozemobacteraceae bacterium]
MSHHQQLRKRGTALVIVLVFATVLLTFGLFYLRTVSQSVPINPLQLRRIQADFLAEGLANIAMLKYQELPSMFHYSYIAGRIATNGANIGPLNTYLGDSYLNGNSTINTALADPNAPALPITFTTDYRILSHKKYDRDSIQIICTVTMGSVMEREVRRTFYAERRRSVP